jgi:alkylation response protein AidB-like acyl-CoA dehydrogenase
MGPTGQEVLDAIAAFARERGLSPTQRQDFARLHIESFLLDRLGGAVRDGAARNGRPGPEASLEKLLSDQHGQRLFGLLHDVAQMAGIACDPDHVSSWPEPVSSIAAEPVGGGLGARHHSPWPWAPLFSRALTIGGGTTQVQRNIIAEKLLGLPREP